MSITYRTHHDCSTCDELADNAQRIVDAFGVPTATVSITGVERHSVSANDSPEPGEPRTFADTMGVTGASRLVLPGGKSLPEPWSGRRMTMERSAGGPPGASLADDPPPGLHLDEPLSAPESVSGVQVPTEGAQSPAPAESEDVVVLCRHCHTAIVRREGPKCPVHRGHTGECWIHVQGQELFGEGGRSSGFMQAGKEACEPDMQSEYAEPEPGPSEQYVEKMFDLEEQRGHFTEAATWTTPGLAWHLTDTHGVDRSKMPPRHLGLMERRDLMEEMHEKLHGVGDGHAEP